MLVPKKTPFLKRAVLTGTIVILVVISAYLVYTNFLRGHLEIIKPLRLNVDVRPLPTITATLPLDFLASEPYSTLHQFGVLPVTVTHLGQPNPFLPDSNVVEVEP